MTGQFRDPAFLEPEHALRLIALASQPYRPPAITEIDLEIEQRTLAEEARFSATGEIDRGRLTEIVGMKHQRDILYAAWARGEIE